MAVMTEMRPHASDTHREPSTHAVMQIAKPTRVKRISRLICILEIFIIGKIHKLLPQDCIAELAKARLDRHLA